MSKFLEDSKFFWTEYHRGKMNVIMHLVSFSFLFYGLSIKSVAFVLTDGMRRPVSGGMR